MYHPTIWKLDAAAAEFHEMGMLSMKNAAFLLAGQLQQHFVKHSPFKTKRRFFHAQWVWALGHIGLLHQVIRWFRKFEPSTELVLEASGANNPYFLQALAPHLTIYGQLPPGLAQEATMQAVYFGCPDGVHSLVNFYKMIERECADIHLVELTEEQHEEVALLRERCGVAGKPYVALQARAHSHDQGRNVSLDEIDDALAPFLARGFSVVSTGIDHHAINDRYPSVLNLPDPRKASFLLSAACDQFVGSNSGAWTIAHAYQRPVVIMNDLERSAWIYP